MPHGASSIRSTSAIPSSANFESLLRGGVEGHLGLSVTERLYLDGEISSVHVRVTATNLADDSAERMLLRLDPSHRADSGDERVERLRLRHLERQLFRLLSGSCERNV